MIERKVEPVFLRSCPICGGPVKASRLASGLPCERHTSDPERLLRTNPEDIKERVTREIARVLRELKKFEKFFRKAVGSDPRSVQRIRMKRLLTGRSFSILAPTGMGKSTFAAVSALFYASKGKKVLIVVPTRVLVEQMYERIMRMKESVGLDVRVVAYGHKGSKEAVVSGEFDVLIVTMAFLSFHVDKGLNLLKVTRERFGAFDLVIADDVDAMLKGSKNLIRILKLIGIREELIERPPKKDFVESIIEDEELKQRILSSNRPLFRQLYRLTRDDKLREKARAAISRIRELILQADPRVTVGKLGQLVVSTATGRVGQRARELFQLLNFSVGSSREGIRNVFDVFEIHENPLEEVLRLAGKLKDGFIVFVPTGSKELIPVVVRRLNAMGIRAGDDRPENIKAFIDGNLDALVGTAYYYGRLVRGLDVPERLKYVLFLGTPKFKVSYGDKPTIGAFATLARAVLPAITGREFLELRRDLRRILRDLERIRFETREKLAQALLGENVGDEFIQRLANRISDARKRIFELIESGSLDLSRTSIVVKREGDRLVLIIPDIRTYIQASGRTSRLYAGGITKGLAILVDSDKEIVEKLVIRASRIFDVSRYRLEGDKLIEFEDESVRIPLDEVIRIIEEERKNLRQRISSGSFDPVKPVLFIVESPNKARTIARFFGRPGRIRIGDLNAYEALVGDKLLIITATGGHVFDLVERRAGTLYGVEYNGSKAVPYYAPIIRARYRVRRRSYVKDQVVSPKIPDCDELKEESHEESVTFVLEDLSEEPRKKREVEEEDYRVKLIELRDKKDVIDALRRLAFEAETVFIATDPDVEGEFIGRSVALNLRPFVKQIRRAEFHEVTPRAIVDALNNPEELNFSRVAAHLVRRIEDRRIGFALSERLKKHVSESAVDAIVESFRSILESNANALESLRGEVKKNPLLGIASAINRDIFENEPLKEVAELLLTKGTVYALLTELAGYIKCRGMKVEEAIERTVESFRRLIQRRLNALSAGRVQTPVLGRVVDRSNPAKSLYLAIHVKSEEGLGRLMKVKKDQIYAYTLYLGGYDDDEENKRVLLERARGKKFKALKVTITLIKEEEVEENPQPPYTTDTLLADAARRLGFSPEKTMKLAQELFELGLITYHRTDSTRVSPEGIKLAREYIKEKFGEDKFVGRPRGIEKGPGVQAAHECIRPTRPLDVDDLRAAILAGDITIENGLTRDHYDLYDLIFRRFIASQMRAEKMKKKEYEITFEACGKEGEYRKLAESSELLGEPKGRALVRPHVSESLAEELMRLLGGTKGKLEVIKIDKRIDFAPEDRVVSQMKQKGIGRPSTYARIVEKLKEKKYVVTVTFRRINRLRSTKRGERVFDLLDSNFHPLVSEERTSDLVQRMSELEEMPPEEAEKEALRIIGEVYAEIFQNEKLKDVVNTS